jgi:hypothetical protein
MMPQRFDSFRFLLSFGLPVLSSVFVQVFFVDRFSTLLGELAEHREDLAAALENFRSSVAARTQWYGALDTDTIAARLQVRFDSVLVLVSILFI